MTASSVCGPERDFRARSGIGFGTSGPSFSSSLSGTASSNMDGMLFECFGPDNNVDPGNMVGNGTLQIVGRYVLFTYKKTFQMKDPSLVPVCSVCLHGVDE